MDFDLRNMSEGKVSDVALFLKGIMDNADSINTNYSKQAFVIGEDSSGLYDTNTDFNISLSGEVFKKILHKENLSPIIPLDGVSPDPADLIPLYLRKLAYKYTAISDSANTDGDLLRNFLSDKTRRGLIQEYWYV